MTVYNLYIQTKLCIYKEIIYTHIYIKKQIKIMTTKIIFSTSVK